MWQEGTEDAHRMELYRRIRPAIRKRARKNGIAAFHDYADFSRDHKSLSCTAFGEAVIYFLSTSLKLSKTSAFSSDSMRKFSIRRRSFSLR